LIGSHDRCGRRRLLPKVGFPPAIGWSLASGRPIPVSRESGPAHPGFACAGLDLTATPVCTYDTEDGTWLWGWDHPSVAPAVGERARQMLQYGQEHGLARLTTLNFACTEQACWELTALAFLLCRANGAYCGPAGSARVFMTFGKITLTTA